MFLCPLKAPAKVKKEIAKIGIVLFDIWHYGKLSFYGIKTFIIKNRKELLWLRKVPLLFNIFSTLLK